MGGVNTIIDNTIQRNSDIVVTKLDNFVPSVSVDTSKFNKGFVDFCVLAGAVATLQFGFYGAKKLYQTLKVAPKALTGPAFLNRYGQGSWAVIADVAHNEEYCRFLADQGLSLILMGNQEQIRVVMERLKGYQNTIRIKSFPVDWEARNFNYQEFTKTIKDLDISFLILPKMQQVKNQSSFGTHVEPIPAYEHYYLLIRHLGPLLQWRSYNSAIMLPSTKDVQQIKKGHGVRQGVISAFDVFMRTLSYEFNGSVDVIAVRGTVQNGFRYLGKQSVSH